MWLRSSSPSWSALIRSELFLQAAKHGVALILCEAFKPVSLVLPANRSTDTLLSRALLTLTPKTRRSSGRGRWMRSVRISWPWQGSSAGPIEPKGRVLNRFHSPGVAPPDWNQGKAPSKACPSCWQPIQPGADESC
jgi:hypothetical protein